MLRNRLLDIRYEYKMTQKKFAAFLGMSQQQYNRYETQVNQPNLETALKISYKIGIPVNDFIYMIQKEDERGKGAQ